jgi:hypothetical protein
MDGFQHVFLNVDLLLRPVYPVLKKSLCRSGQPGSSKEWPCVMSPVDAQRMALELRNNWREEIVLQNWGGG